ncbi:hypothetical protein AB0I28_26205 [Phytomonospora sp. NPDC050363]|uniref:hypothetical protein n=1 Tax=Phytomonospora sp. NPDC050363 TaxID=3155642 RepID=UPI0033FB3A56
MRLTDHPWRITVSTARFKGREYRVLRPAATAAHAALYQTWSGGQLMVDRAAAAELAAAWWLAARSRHSLVHLPLRTAVGECGAEEGSPRLDLVLLHHSLGFPVSRWKEVRARTRGGAPQLVRLPPGALPSFGREEHMRSHYRESRDALHWDLAADTLFLIGSRRAFEWEAEQLRRLAEEGPADVARTPDVHLCAEIEMGSRGYWRPGRRRPYGEVHVEWCPKHR